MVATPPCVCVNHNTFCSEREVWEFEIHSRRVTQLFHCSLASQELTQVKPLPFPPHHTNKKRVMHEENNVHHVKI